MTFWLDPPNTLQYTYCSSRYSQIYQETCLCQAVGLSCQRKTRLSRNIPPIPPKKRLTTCVETPTLLYIGCYVLVQQCAVHTLPAQSGERASQHQSGHACFASSTPSRTLRGCLRHIDNDGADADSRCCSICYQYKATIYYQQELPGISNSSHCCNRRCGVPHQPGSSYALSMNTCRCMPRSAICSTKYRYVVYEVRQGLQKLCKKMPQFSHPCIHSCLYISDVHAQQAEREGQSEDRGSPALCCFHRFCLLAKFNTPRPPPPLEATELKTRNFSVVLHNSHLAMYLQ